MKLKKINMILRECFIVLSVSLCVFFYYEIKYDIPVKKSANKGFASGTLNQIKKDSIYNYLGLPISRNWLTRAEWKGDHISSKNKTVRASFSEWKKSHIKNFISFFGEQVKKECIYYQDIPPSVVLAQMILESNFGLSRLAVKGNNFFGHKYKGKTKSFLKINTSEKFESGFLSQQENIKFHLSLLDKKYKKRIKGPYTIKNWLVALCGGLTVEDSKLFYKKNDIYALSCVTEMCYSAKLLIIINKYNLSDLDKGFINQ